MKTWFEPVWWVWRRWTVAFAVGVMLHAGALFAALYQPYFEYENDDMSGPIAVELAPLPVSPQFEAIDAPLGPRTDEVQAAPDMPDKTEAAKAEDTPALPATPYEPDDPELRMAKLTIKKEQTVAPTEDKTTDKAEQPPAHAATAVPETMAPPSSGTTPGVISAAPLAGLTKTETATLERWQRKIVVHLNKFKRYPSEARRGRIEGDVTVSFAVDGYGRIVSSAIVASSGTASLDKAAIETLERAGILPPPPMELSGKTIELSLPIQYRIKD